MEPLISILIPCYNGEKFIDQCLSSVVDQTYKNLEIIIMNDGSTDKSLNLLYEWQKKDNRIKVLSHLNSGLSESRNQLIKTSAGIYFFLLDIDDTIPSKSIESLYKNSFDGKADLVVGRTNGIYSEGKIVLPYFPVWIRRKNMTNLQYVKSNICTPWASIIRKNFFQHLDISFFPGRVFEDIGIMPYIYLKADIFVAINELTYNYHKHTTQQQAITNFKENAFLKRNDLLVTTNSLFKKMKDEGWGNKSAYMRAINGIFYEILILNNILIHNFTNDPKISRLLKYNAYKILESFGWKLRFSKTPWKTLAYIYIRFSYKSFFKNGIIFKKTFQANYINSLNMTDYINDRKKIMIFEYTEKIKQLKSKNLSNIILEVEKEDYIKNYKLINTSKLKYILIKSNEKEYSDFSSLFEYKNIYGVTVDSESFDSRVFRENENFLIVNIEYKNQDYFSLKRLISNLKQLNYMLRRPLIFLKCEWNKTLIKEVRQFVDLFIFTNNKIIKVKNIDSTDLIDIDSKRIKK